VNFTRKMRRSTVTFEQCVVIPGTARELFALTQDYGRRLEWDPFLKSAKLLGGAEKAEVGVRAWCVARNGLGMETEYLSFNPPRVTAVKMTRGPRLLARFAGSWRFEEIAAEQTRVRFRYHLQARPRCIAWVLTPLFAWLFGRDTRIRLKALKTAVERGTCKSPWGCGRYLQETTRGMRSGAEAERR
jgi:ribosome-associated toxin RatA of RatAB toxin-antitoxin module